MNFSKGPLHEYLLPISLCPLTAGKAERGDCEGGEEPEEDGCGDLFSTAALCAQEDVPQHCAPQGGLGQPAWLGYY